MLVCVAYQAAEWFKKEMVIGRHIIATAKQERPVIRQQENKYGQQQAKITQRPTQPSRVGDMILQLDEQMRAHLTDSLVRQTCISQDLGILAEWRCILEQTDRRRG